MRSGAANLADPHNSLRVSRGSINPSINNSLRHAASGATLLDRSDHANAHAQQANHDRLVHCHVSSYYYVNVHLALFASLSGEEAEAERHWNPSATAANEQMLGL